MSGDLKTEIVKVVSDLLPVKDAYVDSIQPAARETGKALGHVASVINSALRPLRSMQLSWDLMFDRLDGWLAERLKNTPPDQIVEPPPTIAGGVVTGLLYASDEPELRELFVQLLATSMVSTTQPLAHPAFAEFLKQMTPIEARIVSYLVAAQHVPYVLIRAHTPTAGTDYTHWKDPCSELTDAEIFALLERPVHSGWNQEIRLTLFDIRQVLSPAPYLIAAFQNLARLGLVVVDDHKQVEDRDVYKELVRSPTMFAVCKEIRSQGLLPKISRGVITITDYGEQFLKACVAQPETENA